MKNYFRWLTPARSNAAESSLQKTPSGQAAPTDTKSVSGPLFAFAENIQAGWSRTDYNSLARAGFMRNPIVYRCVRLISETAANIPLLLYDGVQEHSSHPLLSLFNRPNARQGGREFRETLVGHLLVSGNAYVEMVSVDDHPREMHVLRPDRVRVLTDADGWVSGYEYSAGKGRVTHRVDASGASPVLHLSLFHPLDELHGFPPLQAALMALDVHNTANRWNKALLDNSARPSGALVYSSSNGANLSDDQYQRLKQELEEGYTGASRAGRPLLLEGGLDWKAMGYSPRDMDFVDGRNSAARDIALTFGVPPMLLGIPGDNTYSNYQEANRAFARQTLLPMINRTLDSFNHWLAPHFGEDIRIAIDEDRVEGLAAERELVWKRLSRAEFLSDDEKREAVGYSPRGTSSGLEDV